jgi:hypothetical protein
MGTKADVVRAFTMIVSGAVTAEVEVYALRMGKIAGEGIAGRR